MKSLTSLTLRHGMLTWPGCLLPPASHSQRQWVVFLLVHRRRSNGLPASASKSPCPPPSCQLDLSTENCWASLSIRLFYFLLWELSPPPCSRLTPITYLSLFQLLIERVSSNILPHQHPTVTIELSLHTACLCTCFNSL